MKLKWYSYVICSALIIVALFCGIKLIDMFGVKNATYGTPTTIEEQQGLDEIERYDFGLILFDDQDNDGTYTYQQTYAPVDFNGNLNEYTMYFNSQPVQNIEQSSGSLRGNITFAFYDVNGAVITSATLEINLVFYEGSTQLLIEIENTKDAVSYFTTYMNYNGAVLKILTKGEIA